MIEKYRVAIETVEQGLDGEETTDTLYHYRNTASGVNAILWLSTGTTNKVTIAQWDKKTQEYLDCYR